MKNNLLLSVFFIAQSLLALAQYDESKVPPYTLPELMVTQAGKKVRTVKEWEAQRRPEILALFAEQVYGKTPTKKLRIHFETVSTDRQALNSLATRKQIRAYFTDDRQHYMDILLYTPNAAQKPVPVFLGLNFSGNQSIHADPGILITKRWVPDWKDPGLINNQATEANRGARARRWPVEEILARGYGLATVYYGDLQPDRADSFDESIHSLFYNKGQTVPSPDEWGAIGTWAWGLSRAMDYLETDQDVDKKRVAVMGHSRLGKAALWAGAQDPRFALVISNDSGEGGAAITRRQYGEQIKRINTSFPHWFAGNYKQYNDRENDLPVDFHELIAIMAPRPVYVASASEDQWSDPKGEYLSLYHAGPVYALYGRSTLTTPIPPEVEVPVGQKTWTGYHMRNGKHDILLYDWDKFMNFADFHFKRK
ncbi:alpha/beta hydrolase family protein [Salmonirosea aquatica]|uniref:Acetylxylan esterase n=1 Tax=Salmonirosea aquatica TaxID=2654236 RepID=A0A7C9FD07_9BACT|nr:acetylxylan esterase [Cytophagaceae bacterium SJW1-29]